MERRNSISNFKKAEPPGAPHHQGGCRPPSLALLQFKVEEEDETMITPTPQFGIYPKSEEVTPTCFFSGNPTPVLQDDEAEEAEDGLLTPTVSEEMTPVNIISSNVIFGDEERRASTGEFSENELPEFDDEDIYEGVESDGNIGDDESKSDHNKMYSKNLRLFNRLVLSNTNSADPLTNFTSPVIDDPPVSPSRSKSHRPPKKEFPYTEGELRRRKTFVATTKPSMEGLVRCDTEPKNAMMMTGCSSPALIRRASQMALKMFGRSFSSSEPAQKVQDHSGITARQQQDHHSAGGKVQDHHSAGGKVKFTIYWSEDEMSTGDEVEGTTAGVEADGAMIFFRRERSLKQVICLYGPSGACQRYDVLCSHVCAGGQYVLYVWECVNRTRCDEAPAHVVGEYLFHVVDSTMLSTPSCAHDDDYIVAI
eukprot:sb/3465001/